MLHGRRRHGRDASIMQPHEQSEPNLAHQPTSMSHANRAMPNQSRLSNHREQKLNSMAKASSGNKRKAKSPHGPSPSQRKRVEHPTLRDEAYIRSTMHIPTLSEYPDAPALVFKQPKASIIHAVQGLAECRSEFKQLTRDAFKCTLYFNSTAQSEVVVGEGRTQVRSNIFRKISMLIPYREPPRTLPGCTCWQNSMSKVYLLQFLIESPA